MLLFLLVKIQPFPDRTDKLLINNKKDVKVYASGSIGQYIDGKCVQTHPEHMVDEIERDTDWCSNINKSKTDYPWLAVSLNDKKMRIKGYSIRNGCCKYGCCCLDDSTFVTCCCNIYSWSVQGSNDNITWKEIHSVKAEKTFYGCENRTYDIKDSDEYRYVKIVQTEPWPGCDFCMCLNKFELYGTTSNDRMSIDDGDDETVSIIGRVGNANQ